MAGMACANWAPVASAATGDLTVQLGAPIVGVAALPTGGGYWEVGADGAVFPFGSAGTYGSLAGRHLNAPIVGIAAAPTGKGYWLVASDGGIFAFGSAGYYGSMGGKHLNAPIVGIAASPTGHGYWEVASDGGIFTFGTASFDGSMGGSHLNAPIAGMAASPTGHGYWLVASDGGIFALGGAPFDGSSVSASAGARTVGMAPDGSSGYWEVASAGQLYSMGDATFDGAVVAASRGPTIVRVADSQVGSVDALRYGPSGSTWCGYFTSWAWAQAGVPIPPTSEAAGVGTWALTHGGTVLPPLATPQPGDAVLWVAAGTAQVWPDAGALNYLRIEHVNIVTQVLPGGDIVTVGGNEGGAVRQMGPYAAGGASSYFGQTIYGFVQPPA